MALKGIIEGAKVGGAKNKYEHLEKFDPKAPTNHLKFTLGLNEYQQELIELALEKTGHTRLSFIRHAAVEKAKEILELD